jgi:hypothetical protein
MLVVLPITTVPAPPAPIVTVSVVPAGRYTSISVNPPPPPPLALVSGVGEEEPTAAPPEPPPPKAETRYVPATGVVYVVDVGKKIVGCKLKLPTNWLKSLAKLVV